MVWIILVAGLLNLFLGLFVWSKNKKERINILFALFCLIVGIMISINFVFRFIPSINVVKWSYAFSVFLAPVAILWIYELDKKRLSKLKITLLFLPALIFFGINIFSTLIIKNINNLTAFGYIGDTGKLFIYYATYISLCIIFAIGKLYIMQKRSTSLITKLQARYTLIGLMLYASSASFTSLVLPSFFNIYNFTSLDSICSLFFIIFTTYAILKHHLMNIKIIATELFVSIFVLAILFNVPTFPFEFELR